MPAGSTGSDRHAAPVLVMVSARFPFRTIAAAPAGPKDADDRSAPPSRRAGDRIQWLPLSADHAASRLADGPAPAFSTAAMRSAVRVSLRTLMGWWARRLGRAGPAACQVPPVAAKMPAVPGWLQVPASSGIPDGVNAAAVRLPRPQRRPAGVAASARRVASVLHLA